MSILEAAPSADGDNGEGGQTGTAVEAKVTAADVEFNDFPIRDLVVKIVGEEGADAIVALVGKVDYSIPYTATINEEKTAVSLEFKPEPLKITAGEGDNALNVEVTIETEKAGEYNADSKNLTFIISATKVTVGGKDFPEFTGMSLEFNLNKK